MRRVRFVHLICVVCGLAWKETERRIVGEVSRCPRCGVATTAEDVVKQSEATYP